MSYLQSILNQRLGIRNDFRNVKPDQPEIKKPVEPEQEIKKPVEQEIKNPVEPPKPKPKNERGAGRKKITPEEKNRRKELIIKKLTSADNEEDVETIKQIKDNASKEEITSEIKATKKKLKLLSDSLNFID